MSDKNRISWNQGAAAYSAFNHSARFIQRIRANPAKAFHPVVWESLRRYVPDLKGARVCVPSSGDNHAVFAFVMLGARVTSCDFSENQLANARRVATENGWASSIEFVCADTMGLEGIEDGAYDFVYTSNGVHVWIDDLPAMYEGIHRVMKPGGTYMLYEIHPFLRPFDEHAQVKRPYDMTGPHEDESEITFTWRVMDILNAMLDARLRLAHIEEMFAEKDLNWPFWISYKEIARGATTTQEELDRMHDWRHNPMAALPNWLHIVAKR